jgi:hypothetical protein
MLFAEDGEDSITDSFAGCSGSGQGSSGYFVIKLPYVSNDF